jgi:hypothetical protein
VTPPQSDEVYRAVTRVFAIIILGFGITIIAVTFAHGGNLASSGLWLGLIFVGLGAGRLYLALRGDQD